MICDTKIKEVNNKMPDLRGLVKKTDYDDKFSEIQGKNFTSFDCNKSTKGKDKTKKLLANKVFLIS